MPYHETSAYRPPILYRSAHLHTIVSALLRPAAGVLYERRTLELPDGDFLDLDWLGRGDSDRLLIALHGLEGSADSYYIRGVLDYFHRQGWAGLGMNQRSCSGRMNRLPRLYHMGATDDLAAVVEHAAAEGYAKIALVGFSLGGNLVLKYLGERGDELPAAIIGGVAFSVPCHIASACTEIDRFHNRLYRARFIKSLMAKVRLKARRFPDKFDLSGPVPKTFWDFDDRYTGPIHGFDGALDYYTRNSSLQFLPGLRRPTLLVNARDDTFLSRECFPYELARTHSSFHFEAPRYGGHVGFAMQTLLGAFWSEQRAFNFLSPLVGSAPA